MASNAFLHIKSHPALGYGKGVFARKELLPGTIIFEEQPLCRAGISDESKEDAYNAMKKPDKQRFLTLYGACCCTDPTHCDESIVTKIWHINAFSHENGTFIYHLASHFNHACLPNAIWEIDDQATIKIQVIRKIEEGEEITVAYFDTIGTAEERKRYTMDIWRFVCGCGTCKVDVEVTEDMCDKWSKNEELSTGL